MMLNVEEKEEKILCKIRHVTIIFLISLTLHFLIYQFLKALLILSLIFKVKFSIVKDLNLPWF